MTENDRRTDRMNDRSCGESKKRKTVRMIALDLDNTTLRTDKSLAPRTREAFRKAMERGVHVVISTGRVFSALPESLTEIEGIEYAVNSNGACIYRLADRKLLYTNYLDPAAARTVLDILREEPVVVEGFTDGHAYINASAYNDLRENGSSYLAVDYILWSRRPVPDVLALLDEHIREIENISVSVPDPAEKERVRRRLEKVKGITITSSVPYNIEIGGGTTSKAEALSHLMMKLGVTPAELMACGDSPNDLAMIRMAGLGVVVDNASDAMKREADFVTASNDEDGVAKAIERFVLAE